MLKNQKLTFLPAWAVCAAEEAEAPEPSAATAAADEAVAEGTPGQVDQGAPSSGGAGHDWAKAPASAYAWEPLPR